MFLCVYISLFTSHLCAASCVINDDDDDDNPKLPSASICDEEPASMEGTVTVKQFHFTSEVHFINLLYLKISVTDGSVICSTNLHLKQKIATNNASR